MLHFLYCTVTWMRVQGKVLGKKKWGSPKIFQRLEAAMIVPLGHWQPTKFTVKKSHLLR